MQARRAPPRARCCPRNPNIIGCSWPAALQHTCDRRIGAGVLHGTCRLLQLAQEKAARLLPTESINAPGGTSPPSAAAGQRAGVTAAATATRDDPCLRCPRPPPLGAAYLGPSRPVRGPGRRAAKIYIEDTIYIPTVDAHPRVRAWRSVREVGVLHVKRERGREGASVSTPTTFRSVLGYLGLVAACSARRDPLSAVPVLLVHAGEDTNLTMLQMHVARRAALLR
eukprot:scaffold518_cov388-Prasinococcus_capsulatus_cf.AAC.36